MSLLATPPQARPQISCSACKLEALVQFEPFQLIGLIVDKISDIIELGLPFTDPIADGPTIQKSNNVALQNGVTVTSTLQTVREARKRGLRIPVLFMGYYNPLLRYGEDNMLRDAKEAGVNGFIMVDLPPEEAVRFRNHCTKAGLSYVPLIAPATSESRMKLLCKIADSFIYVVSRMGVTGATGTMNAKLPELLERVHLYSGNVPAAVGFGVSTREHFLSVSEIAEGVVIGSQIVTTLGEAPAGQGAKKVEEYLTQITGRKLGEHSGTNGVTREIGIVETMSAAKEPNGTQADGNHVHVDKVITDDDVPSEPGLADQLDALNSATNGTSPNPAAIPARFGQFGGQCKSIQSQLK
jgi:tryptophan synthase